MGARLRQPVERYVGDTKPEARVRPRLVVVTQPLAENASKMLFSTLR